MRKPRVLVIDDSAEMLATLSRYLEDHGFAVEGAINGKAALEAFSKSPHDVVLTDLRMKGMDGLDVLTEIHRVDPQVPVVLMTAFGNVESAVEAIQRGAYHYVTKPFKMATLRVLLQRAASDRTLREQNRHLKAMFDDGFAAQRLVGGSAAMRALKALTERVAQTTSPVLVTGETGAGKELVARAIHIASPRCERAFVPVSCAAMPETLLESELFGHVAGAFPGAVHARRGLFAEADGGTLFLDEVGDMPLSLQGKLLRVIETGEIRPVGGEATRVDVRIIASTHQDLSARVSTRAFRDDLFFRLNVVPIHVPALRDRREDIPLLIEHVLEKASIRSKGTRRSLNIEAHKLLEAHPWPGNVRELENVIERLLVTKPDGVIGGDDVRSTLMTGAAPEDPFEACAEDALTLDEVERRYVAAVLRRVQGNKAKAAAILGIDLSTLYRREKQRNS